MCGLYGILDTSTTGLVDADLGIVYQMGVLTQLRGSHSSGLFTLNKQGQVPILKTVGPNYNFQFEKGSQKFMEQAKGAPFLIGHGRYATVGKITKQNAHPFRQGHVTLVHNGTIREGLDVKSHEVEVDSHALAISIAKKGLKEAIGEIKGAWAIIAYDSNTKQINILRNYERDLYYLKCSFGYYIMSEKEALVYIKERNKLQGEIQIFEANQLYTFDPEKKVLHKGDEVRGNTAYQNTYYGGNSQNPKAQQSGGKQYSGPFTGSANKTFYPPTTINGTKVELAYQTGDTVQFTVDQLTIVNGIFNFLATDDKGRVIRFSSGNQKEAATVRTGDSGMADVIGYSMNFETKKVIYMVRFREIEWEKDIEADVKEALDKQSRPVVTYGGETMPQSEWEKLIKEELCASCTELIESSDAHETVAVPTATGYRLYCKHCVSANMAKTTNETANLFRRLQ